MKKYFKYILFLIAVSIMWFDSLIQAQSIYKINDSKDNHIHLSGTSTLHNWVMNAQALAGEAKFDMIENNLKAIDFLNFSLPVENLKGNEKAMDRNAYKALESDKYKYILFKVISSTVQFQQNNKYLIIAIGNLSIAGVTKQITMDVHCQVNENHSITCTGSEKLKMTDYHVIPPTFLMGMMKTGDEITLDFSLTFNK